MYFLYDIFFKKFISVQEVVLHVINTSFMSRTDGANWSHFLLYMKTTYEHFW